jgi:hypothetical protein
MTMRIKITGQVLDAMRIDLARPHGFAHERIGFLTAGATRTECGQVLLLCHNYQPVADEDYIKDSSAGAVIGPDAIRKGLQSAYKTRSALIHVHTHGGRGRPEFSSIDLNSSKNFVPSFFNAVPQMPHGIVVLSDNSARGLFWQEPSKPPAYISGFVRVGKSYEKFGEQR